MAYSCQYISDEIGLFCSPIARPIPVSFPHLPRMIRVSQTPPPALLFTSPSCPFCPSIKRALLGLQGDALIGTLEVLDATRETARAQALGVRSVPWFRIGPLQFEGQMAPAALREWARLAATPAGLKRYFFEMLKSGQRARVEQLIREEPARAATLAALAFEPDTGMETRLGIGAVLEELQGTGLAEAMVPALAATLADSAPRHRADAAHFLSLIGGTAACAALQPYRDDADVEVREIAREALDVP